MQLTFHHRHTCCTQHATPAAHHHFLSGLLAIGVLLASLFAIIRSVDAIVWGQNYKPRVVSVGMFGSTDSQTAARYQIDERTQFAPVSDRILH